MKFEFMVAKGESYFKVLTLFLSLHKINIQILGRLKDSKIKLAAPLCTKWAAIS